MRRPSLLALLACLALTGADSPTPSPPPLDPVVAQVIALAKARALNAPNVDWPTLESDPSLRFDAARGEAGRAQAIGHVLAQLADRHSFYMPPRATSDEPSGPHVAGVERLDAPAIAAHDTTPGGFGRLTIRGWADSDDDAMRVATRLVRAELLAALATRPCGLVVDVAGNGGGNMWPMMGGLAPVYGDGTLVTFEARNAPPQVVNVRGGVLRMNDDAFPRVDDLPALERAPRAVAVIIGRLTASSGEILALGFRGQKKVRFFGSATAGLTTANSTIRLANGGLLALTTARLRDRAGAVQNGPLLPDEPTREPIAAADAWLAEQCR